jgi:hypothetical protein
MATIDERVYGHEPAQLELDRLRESNNTLRKKVRRQKHIIDKATKMLERISADLRSRN